MFKISKEPIVKLRFNSSKSIPKMKKILIATTITTALFTTGLFAQSKIIVPAVVKESFAKKFPEAKNITWEKEKGNYEANWGGKSGEDNSVLYTPAGKFLEAGKAIASSQLPEPAKSYLKTHYKGASVTEAMLIKHADGKVTYEAEVHGKDVVFDEHGNFMKSEKE
jgi:hypothetical protein